MLMMVTVEHYYNNKICYRIVLVVSRAIHKGYPRLSLDYVHLKMTTVILSYRFNMLLVVDDFLATAE